MALKNVKSNASGSRHNRWVTRAEAKVGAKRARREEDKVAAEPTVDVQVTNHGSIIILDPLTDLAVEWMEANLPEDRQTWGRGTVVEPRYVEDILNGMQDAGLVLR